MLISIQAKHNICQVIASLDEEFSILCTVPEDLLDELKPLPLHPLDFIPGQHFMQERAHSLDLDPTNWLWLEEVELVQWIIHKYKKAFT